MRAYLFQYMQWMDEKRLSMHASIGLLLLRLSVGGLMAFTHGWGKLTNFSAMASQFPDPLGLGSTVTLTLVVFAEFFCALLVMLGAATRLAVIPLIMNMSVIAFIVHADDPWQRQEFALLFLVPFLTLLFTGSGQYAVDGLIRSRIPKLDRRG